MFIIPTIITISLISADVRIEQILPDTTIAVVSISSAETVGKKFQESGLSDSFHEIMAKVANRSSESCFFDEDSCKEMMASFGIEGEMPSFPTGYAGWGLYPVVDYETGSVGLGMLALVELGDSNLGEVIEESIGDASSQYFEIESIDLGGREVWLISNFMPEDISMQAMGVDPSAFDRLYLVVSNGYIVVGTEPDGVANALAGIEGDFEEDTLVSSEVFNALSDRCGIDGDLFAAALLTNLADTIVQMDESGMAMMFLPAIKSAIGDIDGIAESITFMPSQDILLEGTYGVYMGDGRGGILGLIGDESPQVSIPSAFISDETLSYSQVQLDLDKLVPLMKDVFSSNPILAMQFGSQMEQIEQMLSPVIASLGSNCHFLSTGHLPIDSNSLGYIAAIECTDEEAFDTFLSGTLPQFGLTPTDFLGNQIYTIDLGQVMMIPMPMDMSISIAIGGGYALFGSTHSVENILRRFANPGDSPKLEFKNSSNQAVSGWGYANPKKSFEIQNAVSEKMTQEMFTEMEEFDPEMAEEMRSGFADSMLMQKTIMEGFTAFLGRVEWQLHADDAGFTTTVTMHRSSEE